MSQLNPQMDDYISNTEDFAKPILVYLRDLIHDTCNEAEETIKWGNPHFSYRGDIMLMLSAHKKHCNFSFYKAEIMQDDKIRQSVSAGKKFGYLEKVTSLSDLPDKETLIRLIREAMAINEQGVRKPASKPKAETPAIIEVPDFFAKALDENPEAKEIFETKSASFRKDYLVWITGAKTDTTRDKRIKESIEWIGQGKGRFWQYQNKRQ